MERAHCLIDDLSGRGFLCLDYESKGALLFEINEVSPGGVRMRETHDLDPLVRSRLRDLGALDDNATMHDCIRMIQDAKTS